MNDPNIGTFAKLSAPFSADEIRARNQNGRDLQYITARTAMNRLDEVVGPTNWWDRYTPMGESALICELTIRLPDGTTLTKSDVGGCSKTHDPSDSEKSGVSDAFKRAAVKFGVARYLYGDGVAPSVREELTRQRREEREERERRGGAAIPPRDPGGDDDREPEPQQAPRQHQPQQQSNGRHGGSSSGYTGRPKSGKALFAWTKEQSEKNDVPLLKVLCDWGVGKGFPARMVQWDEQQASAGYDEGVAFLQHNGHMAGASR